MPPELEEMLRAQLAQSPKGRRPAPAGRIDAAQAAGEIETMSIDDLEPIAPLAEPAPEAPKRRTTTRRKAASADSVAEAAAPVDEARAPKRRTTTRKKADGDAGMAGPEAAAEAPAAKPRAARTRKATTAAADTAAADTAAADTAAADATPAAPKRRTTRKPAEPG